MRQFAALPILIALSACSPLAGCDTIGKLAGPAPIAQGQKLDEQALGLGYASGTAVNILITRTAPFMTPAQAVQVKALKADMDAGLAAAQAAYNLGDASGYSAKIAGVHAVIDKINTLIKTVRQ